MTVLNIKDKVKNNKLNLSGLNLTEIPVKEIVSALLSLGAPLVLLYVRYSTFAVLHMVRLCVWYPPFGVKAPFLLQYASV